MGNYRRRDEPDYPAIPADSPMTAHKTRVARTVCRGQHVQPVEALAYRLHNLASRCVPPASGVMEPMRQRALTRLYLRSATSVRAARLLSAVLGEITVWEASPAHRGVCSCHSCA